jgi:hypothetical protein
VIRGTFTLVLIASGIPRYTVGVIVDPKDKYFLPNGIEVRSECAERHGSATTKRYARLWPS